MRNDSFFLEIAKFIDEQSIPGIVESGRPRIIALDEKGIENNPFAFPSVEIPQKPSNEDFSQMLYQNKPIIASCDEASREDFIAQWETLIDFFATLLNELKLKNLHFPTHSDDSETTSQRLKKGIADSIRSIAKTESDPFDKSREGLLPGNAPSTFVDLKKYLEELCFYFEKRKKDRPIDGISLLKDLSERLEMCGPGLFQDLQFATESLYNSNGLPAWLKKCRAEIVRQEADRVATGVVENMRVHVHTAFNQYAQNTGWQIASSESTLSDPFPIVTPENIVALHSAFYQRYALEAIPFLADYLKSFLIEKFNVYASDGKLFLEKIEEVNDFQKSVEPVLKSFHLTLNDILFYQESDDGKEYYQFSDAIHYMDLLIMQGLSLGEETAGLILKPTQIEWHGETITLFLNKHNASLGMINGIKKNADNTYQFYRLFCFQEKYFDANELVNIFIAHNKKTELLLLIKKMGDIPSMIHFKNDLIATEQYQKIRNAFFSEKWVELSGDYFQPLSDFLDKNFSAKEYTNEIRNRRINKFGEFMCNPKTGKVISAAEMQYIFQLDPDLRAKFIAGAKNIYNPRWLSNSNNRKIAIDYLKLDFEFCKIFCEDGGYLKNIWHKIKTANEPETEKILVSNIISVSIANNELDYAITLLIGNAFIELLAHIKNEPNPSIKKQLQIALLEQFNKTEQPDANLYCVAKKIGSKICLALDILDDPFREKFWDMLCAYNSLGYTPIHEAICEDSDCSREPRIFFNLLLETRDDKKRKQISDVMLEKKNGAKSVIQILAESQPIFLFSIGILAEKNPEHKDIQLIFQEGMKNLIDLFRSGKITHENVGLFYEELASPVKSHKTRLEEIAVLAPSAISTIVSVSIDSLGGKEKLNDILNSTHKDNKGNKMGSVFDRIISSTLRSIAEIAGAIESNAIFNSSEERAILLAKNLNARLDCIISVCQFKKDCAIVPQRLFKSESCVLHEKFVKIKECVQLLNPLRGETTVELFERMKEELNGLISKKQNDPLLYNAITALTDALTAVQYPGEIPDHFGPNRI